MFVVFFKFRHFRRSLYGLPFSARSSSVSSSSLLFYQLYALNVLRQQSNDSIRSSTKTSQTTTSIGSNVPLSTCTETCKEKTSTKIQQNSTYLHQYRYRCACVLIIILIILSLIILPVIYTSKFFMRLSSCNCPMGYDRSLSTSSCTCIDRNECLNAAGIHVCAGLNMQCINTLGSYICRCRPGFTRENQRDSCVDINECDLYTPCNTSISTCVNLPGRYYCQCLISQSNDEQCVPKNVCAEQNDLCGPHSECVVSSSNGYNCEV